MNDQQAEDVINESMCIGNAMLMALYKNTTPDVAAVALMQVVAVIMCNVTLEDGTTHDEMIDNWVDGMKEDFKEKFAQMETELAKQPTQ